MPGACSCGALLAFCGDCMAGSLLIIKNLELYPQPSTNTHSPTLNSEEPIKRGMPEESLGTRERMEINAAKWLGEHGDDLENVDVAIRFDQIAMLVIGEDRALLKYHIKCLKPGTIAAATE
jgi:hypothetical protein